MNIVIFNFSGTGNTWWVAEQLKNTLDSKNKVESYSIENPIFKDKSNLQRMIEDSDHVVIGYPIYASRMPEPMNSFIDSISPLKTEKSLSVFCTQATASGDGAYYDSKRLREKGFNILQTEHFKMGNNFYIPHLPISPVKSKKHLNQINTRALKKVERLADCIINKQVSLLLPNPFGKALGRVQRHFYDYSIETVNRDLKVVDNRCTKCNLCVKNCPVQNIERTDKGIKFNNNCIGCVRCYNYCPKECILLGDKTVDTKKFYRYKGPIDNLKISKFIN